MEKGGGKNHVSPFETIVFFINIKYYKFIMIFLSTFSTSIDAKCRLVVPKDFRSVLNQMNMFVAFRSHKTSAIDCFTMNKMQILSEKIEQDLDIFSSKRDSIESAVFADAVVLKFDKNGRFVLPTSLIEHSKIEKKALFVGRGASFQIWNEDDFKKHQKQAREQLLMKNE